MVALEHAKQAQRIPPTRMGSRLTSRGVTTGGPPGVFKIFASERVDYQPVFLSPAAIPLIVNAITSRRAIAVGSCGSDKPRSLRSTST